jgi:hypothetical protein
MADPVRQLPTQQPGAPHVPGSRLPNAAVGGGWAADLIACDAVPNGSRCSPTIDLICRIECVGYAHGDAVVRMKNRTRRRQAEA